MRSAIDLATFESGLERVSSGNSVYAYAAYKSNFARVARVYSMFFQGGTSADIDFDAFTFEEIDDAHTFAVHYETEDDVEEYHQNPNEENLLHVWTAMDNVTRRFKVLTPAKTSVEFF